MLVSSRRRNWMCPCTVVCQSRTWLPSSSYGPQQLPYWSMAIKCLRAPLWNKPKYRIGFESKLIRENPTLFHIPTFQWWYVSHSILPVYYPIFEIPLYPHMLVGCFYHSPPLGDWISSKPWEAITDISPLMPGNCGKEGGCSGCTRQGKIRRKLP